MCVFMCIQYTVSKYVFCWYKTFTRWQQLSNYQKQLLNCSGFDVQRDSGKIHMNFMPVRQFTNDKIIIVMQFYYLSNSWTKIIDENKIR